MRSFLSNQKQIAEGGDLTFENRYYYITCCVPRGILCTLHQCQKISYCTVYKYADDRQLLFTTPSNFLNNVKSSYI